MEAKSYLGYYDDSMNSHISYDHTSKLDIKPKRLKTSLNHEKCEKYHHEPFHS